VASEGDDYEQDDPVDEAAAGRELAEEAHLYAQFTCTHKIRDFVKEQNSGVPHPFPMIEMIKGALVFSDLSGFSKLCESYVEKFAGSGSAAHSMSQAAEKLNLVVNSVFALQACLLPLPRAYRPKIQTRTHSVEGERAALRAPRRVPHELAHPTPRGADRARGRAPRRRGQLRRRCHVPPTPAAPPLGTGVTSSGTVSALTVPLELPAAPPAPASLALRAPPLPY